MGGACAFQSALSAHIIGWFVYLASARLITKELPFRSFQAASNELYVACILSAALIKTYLKLNLRCSRGK